jgi:type VI secretion system protein ImpG
MSDELLRFYNSELQHLRHQGDRFAKANPQVASNLQIGSEGEYDPYVGRLVEAFAYLNARTRQKLEDGFPEIAGAYLDLLYPHYQRPIPSAMIVQFDLDENQAELFNGYQVPRGTYIETPQANGVTCRFRTIYDTRLWPFNVQDVKLSGLPFTTPKVSLPEIAQGVLQIELSTLNNSINFSNFLCESARFHIRLPQPFSYQLFELLFDDVLAVAIAQSPDDPSPTIIQADEILAVGFGEQEGLVDYPPQSFLGYRLLSELFAFPDKFLFFDVRIPHGSLPSSSRLFLYFYLRKSWKDLERVVSRSTLKLGCCPVINLFPKRAVPIILTQHQTEYPVDVDVRNRESYEVFSIDTVTGIGKDLTEIIYQPFYSMSHPGGIDRFYWYASRNESEEQDELARGTDLTLALVDLDFDPISVEDWRSTIHVETTCSNRNLPQRLPLVPGNSVLEMDAAGAIKRCVCLSKPTECQRPPMGQSRRWKLISHLSLNHVGLTDPAYGVAILKEILGLYDFQKTPSNQSIIEGLRQIETKPTVGRLPGDHSGAICRGMEIRLTFDEGKYASGNLFLFGTVLDHFFSLLSNINSFTRTVAINKQRSGVFHQWPARVGRQSVL